MQGIKGEEEKAGKRRIVAGEEGLFRGEKGGQRGKKIVSH